MPPVPELITIGTCGNPRPRTAGRYYPLTCPQCGSWQLSFGKTDDMAYDSVHHGENLAVVEVPVNCLCGQKYKICIENGPNGGLILVASFNG